MKTTVLLVDDEPLVREELGGFLEDEGYDVLTARDGDEGLELFRQHEPDMVITDAKMPKREGLDLARAILEENAHVPITMITGHGSERMAIAALRLGITDFIKKPVQITDLLAALDRMQDALKLATVRAECGAMVPESVRLLRRSRRYELGNDTSVIPPFVKSLVDDMGIGIDNRRRDGLQLALREVLLNAVEHGNLEVSYQEKTEASEQGSLDTLLAARLGNSELAARQVFVDVTRTEGEILVLVEDQGRGFDWRSIPDPRDPANLLRGHGRGVLLAHLSVDELLFNNAGNQVTLIVRLAPSSEQLV